MLDLAAKLARLGRPLLRWLIGAAVVAGVGAVVLVLSPPLDTLQAVLPALVAIFVWLVCAWVFVYVFATVPAPASAEPPGLRRLLRRLSRGFHWLLLLAFAGISLTALSLGGRLLTEAIG